MISLVTAVNTSAAGINKLSREDRNIFDRANAYFKNIETLKSNFLQTNEFDQDTANGIFYISRPDKFRFEYFGPTESIIVGNGKTISHYDVDLDEVSIVSATTVPMIFLMEKNLGLENMNLSLVKVKPVANGYIIATETIDDGNAYKIEYIFDRDIKTLQGLNVYIDENQKILITLMDTQINLKLNNNLFMFKNPRLYRRRK
jgi:outer membrane lipoprotein-sorting protein